jgi:hypothetical protein
VEERRHADARRRATLAKRALAASVALTFVGAFGLVRAHVPSHQKRKLRALSAPKRFTAVVERDLLAAGIMAPAEAPPGAATAVS